MWETSKQTLKNRGERITPHCLIATQTQHGSVCGRVRATVWIFQLVCVFFKAVCVGVCEDGRWTNLGVRLSRLTETIYNTAK